MSNIKEVVNKKDVKMSVRDIIKTLISEVHNNISEGFNVLGVLISSKNEDLILCESYESMIHVIDFRAMEIFSNIFKDDDELYTDNSKERDIDEIRIILGKKPYLSQVQHMLTR